MPSKPTAERSDWKYEHNAFDTSGKLPKRKVAQVSSLAALNLSSGIGQTLADGERNLIEALSTSTGSSLKELAETRNRGMQLADYVIFRPESNSLRGMRDASTVQPLGLYGERLAMLIGNFNEDQVEELMSYRRFFPTISEIDVNTDHVRGRRGEILDYTKARLAFTDQTMQEENNITFYETASEGILHILFYLALMISTKTPKFFAIDNFGTGLNPKTCRYMIKEMGALAVKYGKQILITTHNPAALDGINLFNETQRLFVVGRSDEGHTRARRIKFKPEAEGKDLKLSEMWMRGYLGGLPDGF